MPKDAKSIWKFYSTIAIIKGKGHRKAGSWDSLSNNLYKKTFKNHVQTFFKFRKVMSGQCNRPNKGQKESKEP